MEIIVRATAVYFFIWIVARGTGKRELSEMTAFELVLLVTVGDMVQQGITQEDSSLVGAGLAVATFAFWIVLFSYVSWRFKPTRALVEGVPVVVVRDGALMERALRLERITVEEVKEGARGQGIADLDEVEVAVLEPDGTFSFIKRSGEQHGGTRNRSSL